jgi:hypothetical protein
LEFTLAHCLARFAIWLAVALCAVTIAVAPASAHAGPSDLCPEMAAHLLADSSALASPDARRPAVAVPHGQAPASAPATALLSSTSPTPDHCACCSGLGCGGMGCCGMGLACVTGETPALPLRRAALAPMRSVENCLSGFEPPALLEPPNAAA